MHRQKSEDKTHKPTERAKEIVSWIQGIGDDTCRACRWADSHTKMSHLIVDTILPIMPYEEQCPALRAELVWTQALQKLYGRNISIGITLDKCGDSRLSNMYRLGVYRIAEYTVKWLEEQGITEHSPPEAATSSSKKKRSTTKRKQRKEAPKEKPLSMMDLVKSAAEAAKKDIDDKKKAASQEVPLTFEEDDAEPTPPAKKAPTKRAPRKRTKAQDRVKPSDLLTPQGAES